MGTLPPFVTAVMTGNESESESESELKESPEFKGEQGDRLEEGQENEDEDEDEEDCGVMLACSDAVQSAWPFVSELVARGVVVEPRYLSAHMRLVHDTAVAEGWVPVFVPRDLLQHEDVAAAEVLLERAGDGVDGRLPEDLEDVLLEMTGRGVQRGVRRLLADRESGSVGEARQSWWRRPRVVDVLDIG